MNTFHEIKAQRCEILIFGWMSHESLSAYLLCFLAKTLKLGNTEDYS